MGKESHYIITLCGVFQDGYAPLRRAQFWRLYHQYGNSIERLVESEEEEVQRLLKRSAVITFSLEELKQKGIQVVTFLDPEYPRRLLTKLKDVSPPILYTCGNTKLNQKAALGYVGSRHIEERDILWTEQRVKEKMAEG